jgi:hypothetical protein
MDEPAKLSEVCADEREVMSVVQLADLSNPFQARPVIKLAAEREAGEAELLREALDDLLSKYGINAIER